MTAKEIVLELKKQIKFYAYAMDDQGNKSPIDPAIASQVCKKILEGTAKPSTEEAFLNKFNYSKVAERQYQLKNENVAVRNISALMHNLNHQMCDALLAGANVSIKVDPIDHTKTLEPIGKVITITIPYIQS